MVSRSRFRIELVIAVAAAGAAATVASACVSNDAKTASAEDAGADASGVPNGDGGVEAACPRGSVRCDGAQLEVCNADGTGYAVAKVCDTPQLCEARSGQDCATAACAIGNTRCADAEFQKCNAGRTAFDTQGKCASAALCVADGGADGGCLPPACQPGEKHCDPACTLDGGAPTEDCIKACKIDLTGFQDTASCGTAVHDTFTASCIEPSGGVPDCQ